MVRKPTKRRSAADQDKIIVDALRDVGRPLSAYELIEKVRVKGVSAPPTVYRALQRLIDDGLAHRLESLNAFVACEHPHHQGKAVFAICADFRALTYGRGFLEEVHGSDAPRAMDFPSCPREYTRGGS